MPEWLQHCIIDVSFAYYPYRQGGKAVLERIFNLAKPRIIIIDDFKSYRIEKEHSALLIKLLAEYY